METEIPAAAAFQGGDEDLAGRGDLREGGASESDVVVGSASWTGSLKGSA